MMGKAFGPRSAPKNTQLFLVGTAQRLRAGRLTSRRADGRVVYEPVVASDVGVPDRCESRGLGPEAKDVVVIIGQHDPPPGVYGMDHSPNDGQRVGDVLEQKTGVCDVESARFAIPKGKIKGITRPELDQFAFSRHEGLSTSLFELAGVALDPDDAPVRPGRAGHCTRELTNPAAHVENCLVPLKPKLS